MPLEMRLNSQPSAYAGSAACRVRGKWPDGDPLHASSTINVWETVIRHSRLGRLDAARFCACLQTLHIRSPITHRRMFNLLDRTATGSVLSLDAATCLAILCDGCAKDKLQFIWKLWDYDHRGFLSETEVGLFLECLYLIGMDTVSATLVVVGEVTVNADPEFTQRMTILAHERLRAYILHLNVRIVAFAGQSIYFEKFWTWAEQCQEFLNWIAALEASWTDSLLDYEAETLKKTHAASAGTFARARPGLGAHSVSAPTELDQLPNCGLPLMGPSHVYPFLYSVKKSFRIHLGNAPRRMRYVSYFAIRLP